MLLNLIFTESQVLLSRKPYASWRDIQDEYADFKASLGPWSAQEVLEFISFEYPDLLPAAEEQVARALAFSDDVVALTFAARSA